MLDQKLTALLKKLAVTPIELEKIFWLKPNPMLVMWDNRATVHRGTEYDPEIEPRVVRRTVIKGDAPIPAA